MTSPLVTLTTSTVNITQKEFETLVEKREQLRILENFVDLEEVYSKEQIKALIKAMEV